MYVCMYVCMYERRAFHSPDTLHASEPQVPTVAGIFHCQAATSDRFLPRRAHIDSRVALAIYISPEDSKQSERKRLSNFGKTVYRVKEEYI